MAKLESLTRVRLVSTFPAVNFNLVKLEHSGQPGFFRAGFFVCSFNTETGLEKYQDGNCKQNSINDKRHQPQSGYNTQ